MVCHARQEETKRLEAARWEDTNDTELQAAIFMSMQQKTPTATVIEIDSSDFAESQGDEIGFWGTMSLRQAVSMMGDERSQKHYERRLQSHHQFFLTALQNRELALENRGLELQNEKLREGLYVA